jgi:molybdopterin synthase catalytic subunit
MIDVLLFAGVAEAAGCDRARIDLDGRPTIEAVEAALIAQFPQIAEQMSSARWASDEHFVSRSHRCTAGAVLAVIPPVAGG